MSSTQISFITNIVLNNDRVMIILRGLPGSGKTTLANKIVKLISYGKIYSSDDYFVYNGNYNFAPEKLPEAHYWNKKRTEQSINEKEKLIIIDNTNIGIWEMDPYIQLARNYNYYIHFLEPDTWYKSNVKLLAKKNVHNVPKENIFNMSLRYEPFDQKDLEKYYPLKNNITNQLDQQNSVSQSLNNLIFEEKRFYRSYSFKENTHKFKNQKTQTSKYDFVLLSKIQNGEALGLQGLKIYVPNINEINLKYNLHFPCNLNKRHFAVQTDNNSTEVDCISEYENKTIPIYDTNELSNSLKTQYNCDFDENFWVHNDTKSLEDNNVNITQNNIENIDFEKRKPSEVKIKSMSELLPRIHEIKPFYPSTNLNNVINDTNSTSTNCCQNQNLTFVTSLMNTTSVIDNNLDAGFSLNLTNENFHYGQKFENAILPPPPPVYQLEPISLILDKEFLIQMQNVYGIPHKPFDTESLEFFERSISLDDATAQRIYFKWVAAQESNDPAFKEAFYDATYFSQSFLNNNNNNNFDSSSNHDHFNHNEYRYPGYVSFLNQETEDSLNFSNSTPSTPFNLDNDDFPYAECYINPGLKNKLLANNWNILKPKPFTEIIEEEKLKLFDSTVILNDNSKNRSTPSPIATESNLKAALPEISIANILKRTILGKKYSDIDAHLLDEIFVGFEFDESATSDFVQSNITPFSVMLNDPTIPKFNDIIKNVPKTVASIDDPRYSDLEADDYDDLTDDFMMIYQMKPKFPANSQVNLSALTAINANLNSAPINLNKQGLVKQPSTIGITKFDNTNSTFHRGHVYDILRKQAFDLQVLRNDYLTKAAQISKNSNKPFRAGIAEYYRQTARDFDKKSKEYNKEALWNILCVNNYGQRINSLDLHGLHVSEVLPTLKNYLNWARIKIINDDSDSSKLSKLTIITGRGKSRSSQHSRLNYIVKNYLQNKGYPPFEESTPGTFTLFLTKNNCGRNLNS